MMCSKALELRAGVMVHLDFVTPKQGEDRRIKSQGLYIILLGVSANPTYISTFVLYRN